MMLFGLITYYIYIIVLHSLYNDTTVTPLLGAGVVFVLHPGKPSTYTSSVLSTQYVTNKQTVGGL